uniref:H15 domain-containing protein n=1 Tax=Periophthalmus magnuspinnatus TaxID=409849 RepID=A0A3B4B507_9GOBI
MSSRRKRAPPVRVDEEAKKRLEWNMLEDRKNEVSLEDDPEHIPTCSSFIQQSKEDTIKAECSLSKISLRDVDWLLQRRVVQLCHQPQEDAYKVGIYLLEAGLGKPEFLSEGMTRLKKANQIFQKMMEYFYDFIIPVDNEEEECDTELERQNIEELYDYVRRVHQREGEVLSFQAQHKALIPVLRPYQCQAVNWMLKREKANSSSPKEPGLHHLWHELVTLCGKKLFYNPYTGCLIREFPLAGVDWPGGILADEMGLGKTVEVLALILCNPRPNLQQEAYTLPEGQSVNYFVPPPPEKNKVPPRKSEVSQPKAKINFPPVRSMLLMAMKQMDKGKGVSLPSMFSYMRSCCGYDPVKNRNHIKRTMKKLLDEKKVKQVKGRGMMGSFKLGFNFTGTQEKLLTPAKMVGMTTFYVSDLFSNDKDPDTLLSSLSNVSTETKKEYEENASENLDDSNDPFNISTSSQTSQDRNKVDSKDKMDQKQEEKVEMAQTIPQEDTDLPKRASVCPFNTSDYRFECICGELGIIDYKPRVQCMNCDLWQHADCVNYKQASLETTPFFCPHCLVAMTPVPTGATLIISPSSICHQWVEEINKHIRSSSLRVLVSSTALKYMHIMF